MISEDQIRTNVVYDKEQNAGKLSLQMAKVDPDMVRRHDVNGPR